MKATLAFAMIGWLLAAVAGAQDSADQGVKIEFGATLNAVLSDTIDTRKSKPGDAVKARTAEDLRAAGTVLIPRGSRLVGHVTEAQARGQGDGRAILGLTFDRAELKDGRAIPLHTTVYALAAPEGAMNRSDDSSQAGGLSGGGFGGGGSAVGSIVSSAGHAVTDDAGAAGAGGASRNTLKPSPGAIGGVNSSGTLYASSRGVFGIDEVTLQQDTMVSGGSSLIISTGRSVHLASGTRILLSVSSGAFR